MRIIKKIFITGLIGLGLNGLAAGQSAPFNYPDYSQASSQDLQRLNAAGDVHAAYTLGYNHLFNDDGAPKDNIADVSKGLNYLDQAHDKGHLDAHSALSTIYLNGMFGQDVDIEKANFYSLEGARRGSAIGKINYGIYNLDHPNKEAAQKAHDYLIEVSAHDLVGGAALSSLTRLYYFGNNHFKADYFKARSFAKDCVEYDDSSGGCEFLLARDYQNGWGGPKDEAASAEMFWQGAERGNAASMWYTGMNLLQGNQVEKNETEAFAWVAEAAEFEYQPALISLGVMYALGQGTDKDFEKSYKSYKTAAALQSAHAVRAMASMHCTGEGRDRNNDICGSGLLLALKHGDEHSRDLLKTFFQMSDSAIDAVKNAPLGQGEYWTSQFPWLASE